MNSAQSLTFVLPGSFDAEALLPGRLARYGDDARYFVSTILRKTARGQADSRGYVSLRADYLRNVMSFRHGRDVIQSLLEAGTVGRLPYRVGERPFAYRLDDRFLDDAHVRRPIQNPRLIRRIQKFAVRARQVAQARLLPVHKALARRQHRLEIDGSLARECLARLPATSNPFDVQGVLVADIEEKRFRLSVGRYRRVANSITNLKRELRSALRCGGEPLTGVDVACAQPCLLALLIQMSKKPARNVTSYNACAVAAPPASPARSAFLPTRFVSVPQSVRRLLPAR